MAKIYAVISGKGGVGKTTSTVNLGAALSEFGQDVLVVDANLTTPNIGLHLGAPIVPVTLNHVLLGKTEAVDAIYEHSSGLKVLPSSLSVRDLKKIKNDRLKGISKKLKKISDFIFLDSAAGLGEDAIGVIDAADEILIITNPDMPSVTDALKTIKVAEEKGKNVVGVIINKVRGDGFEMSLNSIKDMLEVPVLGIVPEAKEIRESLYKKSPVIKTHPGSSPAENYKEIAAKLIGRNYRKNVKKKGFFFRLLGR